MKHRSYSYYIWDIHIFVYDIIKLWQLQCGLRNAWGVLYGSLWHFQAILLENSHVLASNSQRNGICEVLYAAAWICGEFSEWVLLPFLFFFWHPHHFLFFLLFQSSSPRHPPYPLISKSHCLLMFTYLKFCECLLAAVFFVRKIFEMSFWNQIVGRDWSLQILRVQIVRGDFMPPQSHAGMRWPFVSCTAEYVTCESENST